jgi:hypothetical protein
MHHRPATYETCIQRPEVYSKSSLRECDTNDKARRGGHQIGVEMVLGKEATCSFALIRAPYGLIFPQSPLYVIFTPHTRFQCTSLVRPSYVPTLLTCTLHLLRDLQALSRLVHAVSLLALSPPLMDRVWSLSIISVPHASSLPLAPLATIRVISLLVYSRHSSNTGLIDKKVTRIRENDWICGFLANQSSMQHHEK